MVFIVEVPVVSLSLFPGPGGVAHTRMLDPSWCLLISSRNCIEVSLCVSAILSEILSTKSRNLSRFSASADVASLNQHKLLVCENEPRDINKLGIIRSISM